MKLSRFISVSFVLSLLLFSCNKETNNIGGSGKNNSVYISKLGYKFNESAITKSGNKEKVVDVATVDIDDDYMLVAELVNVGNIEFCETKSKQDVTNLTVVTFYDQESKGVPRVQKNVQTTFELPAEGGCTALFLGDVTGSYTLQDGTSGTTTTITRDGGKANSVSSGNNLCWISKTFSDPITDGYKVDLSSMTPLFAQITTIGINQKTQGATVTGGTDVVDAEWPIESVTDVAIVKGVQAESGEISFTSTTVMYTAGEDAKVTLDVPGIVNATGTSVAVGKNVIPNEKEFALAAYIKLKGQTSPKSAGFSFGKPLNCGNRYAIQLSVKKKGIKVKYVVNTEFKGIYNKKFDDTQNKLNGTAQLGSDGVYYYKYGDEISFPTSPSREIYENFNPMNVLRFEGWYKEKECTNKYTQAKITLTVDNFESLKTSDIVYIYAHFNPIWYYYDVDTPTYEGGKARVINEYLPGTIGSEVTLKSTRFNKLPIRGDLQKYFESFIFKDKGYTDDKQDGYWFCKWTKIDNYKDHISLIPDKAVFHEIENGQFGTIQGVTFNKDDFFFIPALGARNSDDRPYDIDDAYIPHKTGRLANHQGTTWNFEGGTINDVGFNLGCMSGSGIFSYPKENRFNHGLGTGVVCYWPDPTYPTGPVI